jgi:hypothetical protein
LESGKMDNNEYELEKARILAENIVNQNEKTTHNEVYAELEDLRELLKIIENINKQHGGLLNELTYEAIRLKRKIRELENDY